MKSLGNFLKNLFEDKEDVTIYPTYGYRDGNGWKIPVRIWVHEPREMVEGIVRVLAENVGNVKIHEQKNLCARLADIVADSESRERVVFEFDNDPKNEKFSIGSREGGFPKSDLNGIVEGFIKLSDARALTLLAAQNALENWLTFRVVSQDHSGVGRVRLIEPEGLSVVSDVDDTIKVTEIPAGAEVVVRNTFFRDFRAAPGMANRYKNLEEACFHYVSGGPWQLYEPLSDFLMKEGFPEGSFHMKSVPKNLLSPTTWKDFFKLVGDATLEQKLSQISEIMRRFPGRRFILIGDSGEHDPEVYRQIRARYGHQVEAIWIRDVVNDRNINPHRLDGMKTLEAQTVLEGVSRFQ
jgi:Phosphatidate phosphatase APP1, catalytic domain